MSWRFPVMASQKNARNQREPLDVPRADPRKAVRRRLDPQRVSVAGTIEKVFVERKTLEISTGAYNQNCIIEKYLHLNRMSI
jgi:hypothetical protein